MAKRSPDLRGTILPPERRVQLEARVKEIRAGVLRYPVTLTPDTNETITVTFIDVPHAVTFGYTKEEALRRARDAFATIVEALMDDGQDVPAPTVTLDGDSVVIEQALADRITKYWSEWETKQ
jgi:antitoxin HicB